MEAFEAGRPVAGEPDASAETTLTITSDGDIVSARRQGRTFVLRLGFSSPEATLVATAISELARNIVQYATRGEIVLRPLAREGRPGVLVIARDRGPGIPQLLQASLADRSLAAPRPRGLRAMRCLVDEFELVSSASDGTTVAVTKWKS